MELSEYAFCADYGDCIGFSDEEYAWGESYIEISKEKIPELIEWLKRVQDER